MSSKQYDIAIIGGSLSARIAATLLAKSGKRVLFLRCREAKASAWFHSSLFLEKLLGILGGRSCFTRQEPIQVISKHVRMVLHADTPLEEELQRELGREAAPVQNLLESLNDLGRRIEELFWENLGLPWPSFKAGARFKLLSIRHKLNVGDLNVAFEEKIKSFDDPARHFLTDLFQGLALRPIDRISHAEAALLWIQANRPENLTEPDFSELLDKRFEQFHGNKAELGDLKMLDWNGNRCVGGTFNEGVRFEATEFLLGDVRWLEKFALGKPKHITFPTSLHEYRTTVRTGRLSPLLGRRVICGGDLPLRLAINANDETVTGDLICFDDPGEELIRQQLLPILPFVEYDLETREEDANLPEKEIKEVPDASLTELPLKLATNLYCADSVALLPALDAAGAALLAWTLAEHLGGASQKA